MNIILIFGGKFKWPYVTIYKSKHKILTSPAGHINNRIISESRKENISSLANAVFKKEKGIKPNIVDRKNNGLKEKSIS
jgi:hypothetical protein